MLFLKIVNSIVQIIIFSLIPFIWWFIHSRNEVNFLDWIGLRKIENKRKGKFIIWMAIVTVVFMILGVFNLYMLRGVEMTTSEFSAQGIKAIPSILIYSIFNTALPEELLFRGFILKRLCSKFGFNNSNIIQSILFGLMHGILFFSMIGIVKTIIVIVSTSTIGWMMGYINENKANGSIIPSWIIHSIENIFSGLCAAFLLI